MIIYQINSNIKLKLINNHTVNILINREPAQPINTIIIVFKAANVSLMIIDYLLFLIDYLLFLIGQLLFFIDFLLLLIDYVLFLR